MVSDTPRQSRAFDLPFGQTIRLTQTGSRVTDLRSKVICSCFLWQPSTGDRGQRYLIMRRRLAANMLDWAVNIWQVSDGEAHLWNLHHHLRFPMAGIQTELTVSKSQTQARLLWLKLTLELVSSETHHLIRVSLISVSNRQLRQHERAGWSCQITSIMLLTTWIKRTEEWGGPFLIHRQLVNSGEFMRSSSRNALTYRHNDDLNKSPLSIHRGSPSLGKVGLGKRTGGKMEMLRSGSD